MTKNKMISVVLVLALSFVIGVVVGVTMRSDHQAKQIEQLEERLSETQHRLIISNDQLNQLNMYQERDLYMGGES